MRKRNWIANKVLTYTANLLFAARLTDQATAYKAFRREAIRRIGLRSVRFEFLPIRPSSGGLVTRSPRFPFPTILAAFWKEKDPLARRL